ncbi:adult-specific rigid cuticular protein 15.7, partial [Nephila pilipes]
GLVNHVIHYDIKDKLGTTNHKAEVRDSYGKKKGSFTIADNDGGSRRVEYVTDRNGFMSSVKTNELETTASSSTAALIASPYDELITSVMNHAVPLATIVGQASPVAVHVPYNGAITNDAGLDLRYGTGKVLI